MIEENLSVSDAQNFNPNSGDTDGDSMPDKWETSYDCMNPKDGVIFVHKH